MNCVLMFDNRPFTISSETRLTIKRFVAVPGGHDLKHTMMIKVHNFILSYY